MTLEGYAAHVGQTATITVIRGGVVSGMAQGTIGAGDPALEVNHPGGVAWGTGPGAPNVTPNIKAGDVVTADFSGGCFDSAVTQSPTVTSFTHTPGSTRLVVNGTLGAPGGPGPITGQLEQRIVEPALTSTDVGRRDVRAGGPADGVSSSALTFLGNTFTATYDFKLASTADIAAGGQMRVLTWMNTDAAANRQAMTIAEFGEVGGPAIGGGPPGPGSAVPNAPPTSAGSGATPSTILTIRTAHGLRRHNPGCRDIVPVPCQPLLARSMITSFVWAKSVFARSRLRRGSSSWRRRTQRTRRSIACRG